MTQLLVQWRTQTVPIRAEDQVAYLLVSMKSEAVSTRAPLNLCLALDRSPSMRQELPALKQAALHVVEALSDGDILSIVAYDGGTQIILPATRIDTRSRNRAQVSIKMLDEGNDTYVSNGLGGGMQELRKHHGQGVVSRLVLLADGQTNGDQYRCLDLAKQFGSLGIPIFGFGLGAEWESELFTELGKLSGGSCEYLKDGSAIKMGFLDAVKLSQGIVARNAMMSLELSPGLRLRRVGKVQPAIEDEVLTAVSTISVPLGDLSTTLPTAVLFEVMLPYQPAGTYLAGRLHLSSTLSNGQPESVSADVVVTYADQPNHNVVPEVANIVERVTAHRLRTSAEQDLAAGEIGRATMKLKNAATRLLDLGELELGQETQQLALDVERLGGVSAAGQMALKHGTRKLTGKLTL